MSRKKRNLRFIRTKNNLRRGIVSFYLYRKVSNELNKEHLKMILTNTRKQIISELFKNYKINAHKYVNKLTDYKIGLESDDFKENCKTIQYRINLIGRINR